jgi:hypothetical protein
MKPLIIILLSFICTLHGNDNVITSVDSIKIYSAYRFSNIPSTTNIDSIINSKSTEYIKQSRSFSIIIRNILDRLESQILLETKEVSYFRPYIICEIEEKNVHLYTFAMDNFKILFMNGKFYKPDKQLYELISQIIPYYQSLEFEN